MSHQYQIDHIVLFSGCLGSFETARRVIDKCGVDKPQLWFFDTLIEVDDLQLVYAWLNILILGMLLWGAIKQPFGTVIWIALLVSSLFMAIEIREFFHYFSLGVTNLEN